MRSHRKHVGGDREALYSTGAYDATPDEEQVRDVYRLIYRCVGNREEAEELTERTFERALRARQDATALSRQAMAERLLRSAASVIEEHLHAVYRSSAHSLVIAPNRALAETGAWQRDEVAATDDSARILAQLPADDRDLLSYRFLSNASLDETAAQMHMPVADAMALQWSALQNAARLMAQERMLPLVIGDFPVQEGAETPPSMSGVHERRGASNSER